MSLTLNSEITYAPTERSFPHKQTVQEVTFLNANEPSGKSRAYITKEVPLVKPGKEEEFFMGSYKDFFKSAEFLTYATLANQELGVEETHVVAATGFEQSADGQSVKLFFPSIQGETLNEYMKSKQEGRNSFGASTYDFSTLCHFIADFSTAVHTLHDKVGVLHNDIHSENILVGKTETNEAAFYLVDLGWVEKIGDTFENASKAGAYAETKYFRMTTADREHVCATLRYVMTSKMGRELWGAPELYAEQETELLKKHYGVRVIELFLDFESGKVPMTFDTFGKKLVALLSERKQKPQQMLGEIFRKVRSLLS